MRIGLVCPYNITSPGGVQECVLALRRELNRRGHETVIITPRPGTVSGAVPDGVVFLGNARAVKSFHTTSQLSVSVSLDAVDELLARQRFDVLHFHEPWVPFMSLQLLSRSAATNIATFHATLPETMMKRTIERVITPYTKQALKYLHGLSACSATAAEYVHNLTDKPIEIIPNGIDLQKYQTAKLAAKVKQPQSRKSVAPASGSSLKTIFYIGRLEKRKGLPYLLRAYEQLCQRRTDLRLVIAGDGVMRGRLEAMVRQNNLKRVRFIGYLNDAEKLGWLGRSDLLCSPAPYGESFGIVLLEAMAAGLPVVAGDNNGYREVLVNRGTLSLVDPKNCSDFSRRLELLLYDDELRELWLKWAGIYIRQFDYPAVVDHYEAFYNAAHKNNHGR